MGNHRDDHSSGSGGEPADPPGSGYGDEAGSDEAEYQYLGVGIALGTGIGTALSVALDNWGLLGAGIGIGVALGVALSHRNSKPGSPDVEPGEPKT